MARLSPVSPIVTACMLSVAAGIAADRPVSPAISIGANGARLVSLTLGAKRLAIPAAGGGFRIYDATNKKEAALPVGTVTQDTGRISFACKDADVLLRAEFERQAEFITVTGELENLRGDERGFILDYGLPRLSIQADFSNELEQRWPMTGAQEQEGNVFPVATMCSHDTGVAMAIPPSAPRVFGMVGSDKGMAVRFYLGTSPKPKRFPNRASFAFIIYGCDSAWGFRSALSLYYTFFPDYYSPRLKTHGLFMFQMRDRVPPNIGQYGFDLVEPQWDPQILDAALARDNQHGIATFPYMIVGQREIKFLPDLPRTYDEAMAVYDKWTVADHAGHRLTKENAASEGDIHLKQEVESSACKTAAGKYSVVIRDTKWGRNSVSFKINPNPDLFQDQQRPTVASYAFSLMDSWLKQRPAYGGLFTDSLGANWPAVLNYRPDHFVYARYPLTLDPNGRVALHNEISHYEYLETLRRKMRASDRLLLANGVYCYKSKKEQSATIERQKKSEQMNEFIAETAPPEHYRAGTKLGRFFCASLLDVASCEFGVGATVEQCRDIRVLMGQKQFAFLNYHWEDPDKVEAFINRSLCYGIFASSSANFFTDVEYETNPRGYLRDKPLLDWFVPLVSQLSRAGWEPLRCATLEGRDISCERYGKGDQVYFTLFNDSETKAVCALKVDLKSLGLPDNAVFTEIARHVSLSSPKAGGISLELQPKKAYVVQLSRTAPR